MDTCKHDIDRLHCKACTLDAWIDEAVVDGIEIDLYANGIEVADLNVNGPRIPFETAERVARELLRLADVGRRELESEIEALR